MSRVRIILIISLVVLAIMFVASFPDGKTRVVFCDVGQGDGALVIQKNFQMLIDTGGENRKMLGCLEKYMPFWDKTIEVVVISHWDTDHSGGLKQIQANYNVQNIYSSDLVKNDVIKYGLISFELLGPDQNWGNDNDNSVTGVLNFDNKKILFLGDVTGQVEQKLVWRKEIGKVDVFKVSHHGSAAATSQELVNEVKPAEAVISVGKNNKFGHPTKVVLERLNTAGIRVRRTDEEGDIELEL
jgi:competence protein ComEC